MNVGSRLKNVVSLSEEMFAYETLWGMPSQTQKSMKQHFSGEYARPSQVLERLISKELYPDSLNSLYAQVRDFVSKIKVRFSICLSGAFQYPAAIRSARYPAELAYYRGSIGLVESPCVSIVGARKASAEGQQRARQLARGLVERKFTIVSGLAAGIDTAAMKSAIDCGGSTIGVIGTPLSEVYPAENSELQELVATKHLLFSHVPFYRYKTEPFKSRKYYFPQRNELMAALSVATIIVEASDTSGSLTQARACLQQGRKLFILNSCFQNSQITWPKTYEARGAIRVRDWDDVWQNLKQEPASDRQSLETA